MRQTALVVDSVPRRTASRRGEGKVSALRALPSQALGHVRLHLVVASIDVFALRQTLHRALGKLAHAYVVKVDYRHGETTLHVDLARKDRDTAMPAIMMALPAAEFGVMTALGE